MVPTNSPRGMVAARSMVMGNATNQSWDFTDEAGDGSFHDSTCDDAFLSRDSPQFPHALIAFDSAHPRMAWLANTIGIALERAGFITDVADVFVHSMPAPQDYELVIVGMMLNRLGDHGILRWVESVATELGEVPSALFVMKPWWRRRNPIRRRLRWHPQVVHVFPRTRRSERYERSISAFVTSLANIVRDLFVRSRIDLAAPVDQR